MKAIEPNVKSKPTHKRKAGGYIAPEQGTAKTKSTARVNHLNSTASSALKELPNHKTEDKLDNALDEAFSSDPVELMNDGKILNILSKTDINYKHLNAIKELTDFNDEVIADWLNVDVKTLRSYRKPTNKFKENVKEQILVLLALMKHGMSVFGSREDFKQWLNSNNFYFDNKKPGSFLNTVTGVRFVNDNLTAIEYGDNV